MREPDVRAIIRLLGEVSVLAGDLSHKKRHLLSRLCHLIEGDRWSWTLDRRDEKSRRPSGSNRMSGGRAVASLPENSLSLALSPRFSEDPGSDLAWGTGRTITACQIGDETISSIHIVRKKGRPPFSPRDLKIARIILSEITWLHEPGASPGARRMEKNLPPRQRATLVHLIDGLSRPAIAKRLGISTHTLHGYIKDIYKHYRVNSRAELVKKFTLGWQPGA
jgi:DNA-binding CsgD family transcriptional regulator